MAPIIWQYIRSMGNRSLLSTIDNGSINNLGISTASNSTEVTPFHTHSGYYASIISVVGVNFKANNLNMSIEYMGHINNPVVSIVEGNKCMYQLSDKSRRRYST